MLTRGLWWPGLWRKEEDDDDRRRRGVGLSWRDVAGTLRAPGHRGLTCGGSGVDFGSNSGVGRAQGLMQKPWTAP
jgi:hypothetical protein